LYKKIILLVTTAAPVSKNSRKAKLSHWCEIGIDLHGITVVGNDLNFVK